MGENGISGNPEIGISGIAITTTAYSAHDFFRRGIVLWATAIAQPLRFLFGFTYFLLINNYAFADSKQTWREFVLVVVILFETYSNLYCSVQSDTHVCSIER